MIPQISRRCFLVGCTGAISLVYATPGAAAPNRKDIDLRTNITGDPTWVLFFGRQPDLGASSFAGHAFVGIGKEDSVQRSSWLKAFGLYPKDHVAGGLSVLFGPVPGELKQDAWSHSDLILSVRVSTREFDAVNRIIDNWTARTNGGATEYQLMYQDCVSFALEAASALKLKLPAREALPDRTTLPVSHIRKLSDTNSTIDFANGVWNSNDSGNRWKLEIAYDQVTWTEKNSAGQTLTKVVNLQDNGNRTYTINRDNTNDVLQYLGARDSVRQAILGRSPRPSYIKLQRQDETRFGVQWFGLKWTLDSSGNLTQLIQPGSQPPAPFTLLRAT